MTVPAGAQRSEDGHYWWDTGSGEWKTVPTDDPQHPQNAGAAPAAGGAGGAAGQGEPTHEELAQIQSVDQLDQRVQPYFQPRPSTPGASDSETADVLTDEPHPDAGGVA